MGTVVQLRRPAISAKVIKELLALGYLQPAKRYKPHIVERALARLRGDLVRDGVVHGSVPPEDRAGQSRRRQAAHGHPALRRLNLV